MVAGPFAGSGAEERTLALVETRAAILVWDRWGWVWECVHEVMASERWRKARGGGGGGQGRSGRHEGRARVRARVWVWVGGRSVGVTRGRRGGLKRGEDEGGVRGEASCRGRHHDGLRTGDAAAAVV